MPTLDAENREVEVVLDREAEEEPRRLVRPRQPERDPATGREGRRGPGGGVGARRRGGRPSRPTPRPAWRPPKPRPPPRRRRVGSALATACGATDTVRSPD